MAKNTFSPQMAPDWDDWNIRKGRKDKPHTLRISDWTLEERGVWKGLDVFLAGFFWISSPHQWLEIPADS